MNKWWPVHIRVRRRRKDDSGSTFYDDDDKFLIDLSRLYSLIL